MATTIALSARASLPNFASFFPQASTWSSFKWTASPFDSLLELFPPFLLAVPKKKTSHSRKAMRSANKGLKDKRNIVHCSACGSPKLAHNLCPNCYSTLSRGWKTRARAEAEQPPSS